MLERGRCAGNGEAGEQRDSGENESNTAHEPDGSWLGAMQAAGRCIVLSKFRGTRPRETDLASEIVTTKTASGATLSEEIHLATTVEAAFAYLSDAANLATAMPAWLRLEVCTPLPITMDVGTVIEYRLRIYGVPVPWRSEFTIWEPPHRFAYEQRRGPFRRWMHEHVFQPDDDGGVCLRDAVDYSVPGGRIIDRLIVSGLLARLFRHRAGILTRAISSA